jgi:hypothetical protein
MQERQNTWRLAHHRKISRFGAYASWLPGKRTSRTSPEYRVFPIALREYLRRGPVVILYHSLILFF